jgi:hypothetical protein
MQCSVQCVPMLVWKSTEFLDVLLTWMSYLSISHLTLN